MEQCDGGEDNIELRKIVEVINKYHSLDSTDEKNGRMFYRAR